MAVPEEVYQTGPSQEQVRMESDKIKVLLEKLRGKHPHESEDAFFSDYKKLEAYLTM